MIDNKKIIGVCLTKVQDDFRRDYLTYLYKDSIEKDYKIIVFNSLLDLYYGDVYDTGSKSVFSIINYDYLDALIIICEGFYDHEMIDGLIKSGKEHELPVILINGEKEGCYSVVKEYREAYKDIIRHIIEKHNARDIFFIGGRRLNDPVTETRLACCRDAMAEYSLELPYSNIDYGEYWEVPPKIIVDRIIKERGKLPDAFVCANDSMAMAVCEQVAQRGYEVPKDVIVTGFDGLISADYFVPRLTTCKEDIPKLASMTVDIIGKALEGELGPGRFYDTYFPYFSESCGCGDDHTINYRERERILYKTLQDIQGHEFHIYKWVDHVLESDNINNLSSALKDYVLPNSSVCLRDDFLITAMGHEKKLREQFSDEFFVISSRNMDYSEGKQGKYPVRDMVPDLRSWIYDKTMCVITSIFVEDQVCGFYMIKTDNIVSTGHKLNRLSKIMNVAFSAMLNRMMKKRLQIGMQNAAYTDVLTGLPNLKGLTKWFDEFSSVKANHEKTLAVSIYELPQYKYIYEAYGIQDIEEVIQFVGESLKLSNAQNGFVARTGDDEFIVVNYCDTPEDVSKTIDSSVGVFFEIIEGYNSGSEKEYYVEVNCGCTVVNPGWNNTLRTFIKLADAEMYMNRLKAGLGPVIKDEGPAEKTPKEKYNEFSILLDKNLFTYFFQPIVDAKTGEIYAYEALMRTAGGIKMNPLEILEIAKEYGKLYAIEKATMFNVLERYRSDPSKFGKAKVFVNSIPGNFLKGDDLQEFGRLYHDCIQNIVIEITEQDTVSDEELDAMKLFGINSHSGAQIAIDDYGTGHSNIVNLLRYEPQIIKIDRFLITNIQNDTNKQMFVKSTIEFSKMNGIKVLAEGVETREELMTVISYGVDLIQGYYTARPAPEPIGEIPANIKDEIINENIALSRYNNDQLTFTAHDGDTVDLYKLSLDKYVRVIIEGGVVRLVGDRDHAVDMEIRTADRSVCVITLDDVNLKGNTVPPLSLGSGSITELCLSGNSLFHKEGIYVPEGSSLHVTGSGNLHIIANRNGSAGIGSGYDNKYGNITFENTGEIIVESSGDKTVAVGGGSTADGSIKLISGRFVLSSTAINAVGIGSAAGRSSVTICQGADVEVKSAARESVGVGSINGNSNVSISGKLEITSDGEASVGIGVLSGNATITFDKGSTSSVVHGDCSTCIGSVYGKADIRCISGVTRTYGEGERVCAIGSLEGSAITTVCGGTLEAKLLSGHALQFGNPSCRLVVTGGNVIAWNEEDISPVNTFGDKLYRYDVHEDRFEHNVIGSGGEYIYKAQKRPDDPKLSVYLPDTLIRFLKK